MIIIVLTTSVLNGSSIGITGTKPFTNYASYGQLSDNYTIIVGKDSFIIGNSPNMNNGANQFLKVQYQKQMRSLVSFYLPSFENLTIGKATLRVYAQTNGFDWGNGETVEVHKLTTDWTEGNGYDSVKGTGQGATWNCATDNNISNYSPDCNPRWGGGGFFGPATDTSPVTNYTKGVWLEFDVTNDINYLSNTNTTNNIGWIIKKTNEQTSGAIAFASKESGSNQPQLVLNFANFTTSATPEVYDGSKGTLTLAFGHAYLTELPAIQNTTNYNFTGNISPVVTKIGNSGYITMSDLINYKNKDWQILSHSMTHPRISSTTSDSVLKYEIVQSKNTLTNNGFCITGYESPFDVITTNSSVYIKHNYKWAVINPNRQNTLYSISHDGLKWGFKTAVHYSGVGNGLAIHDFTTAKAAIDYAITNHTYLILNFHQMDYSGNTYSTPPPLFWQILQYAKQQSDSGQLNVESTVQALGISCP